MGYSTIDVDDIEGSGPGGAVSFEHDESETGREEVSVVVAGSGHWRVDGEEVPVRVGTFVGFDPGTTRCPDGLTFVSIGARRGSYEARGPF